MSKISKSYMIEQHGHDSQVVLKQLMTNVTLSCDIIWRWNYARCLCNRTVRFTSMRNNVVKTCLCGSIINYSILGGSHILQKTRLKLCNNCHLGYSEHLGACPTCTEPNNLITSPKIAKDPIQDLNTCSHIWESYTPLQGAPYRFCSKCDIKASIKE